MDVFGFACASLEKITSKNTIEINNAKSGKRCFNVLNKDICIEYTCIEHM